MYAYATTFGDMRQPSAHYSATSRCMIVAVDKQGTVVGMVALAVPTAVSAGAAPVAHELRDATARSSVCSAKHRAGAVAPC